jgi:type IV pilus assembly protein PilQ
MNTRTPPTLILALLAAMPAYRVLAQQPAAPAAAEAAATPPAAEAASAAPGIVAPATRNRDAAGRDTLSVDFPDEDIRNILRNVADLFELNIIMPDTLQGKTTIKLRDVTWRQIFQSVLQQPLSTEVFLINYAKAGDILPTITSLVDSAAGGKIVVDARSNSLVITERPTRMNRIRPIVEQLDRATDQVMIESKFVEVSDTDVKNIGVNWSSLAGYQLGVGGIQNEYLRGRESLARANTSTNNGTSQRSTNEVRTTAGTGRDTTQRNGSTTASTVTATGGTTTTTSTTGTTGDLSSATTQNNGTVNTGTTLSGLTNTFDNLNSLLNTGGTSRALSAVFSAADFNVVLSALQSLQKTKVVSNPTIVTLNNTQAVINVGQERPIPNYTYNTERGVYEVSGFTYRPIGVILKVTPQVNSRGFIKLTVEPEVSQSNRDANFNGAAIPIVESRKANTTVSLRDGFTMGIGGLLQSQSNNGTNKVPVLGSIPVVGRLFKSESRNSDSTNLIIFITAKTISAEGASVEQVFDSERVRGLDLRREDLPGHRDGSNPFISSIPKTQK